MHIELKHKCISPAFVIGSDTLTRALVSSVIQPAAISNAKYRKKVRQQLHPLIKLKRLFEEGLYLRIYSTSVLGFLRTLLKFHL